MSTILPSPKTPIAIAKVLKIDLDYIVTHVISIDGVILKPYRTGKLRREDMRVFETDSLKVYENFGPGDMIQVKILSDMNNPELALSTSADNLGVIYSTNVYGEPLVPVDWNTMKDSKGVIYKKKVASSLTQ